jgi:hypothetical protein
LTDGFATLGWARRAFPAHRARAEAHSIGAKYAGMLQRAHRLGMSAMWRAERSR